MFCSLLLIGLFVVRGFLFVETCSLNQMIFQSEFASRDMNFVGYLVLAEIRYFVFLFAVFEKLVLVFFITIFIIVFLKITIVRFYFHQNFSFLC